MRVGVVFAVCVWVVVFVVSYDVYGNLCDVWAPATNLLYLTVTPGRMWDGQTWDPAIYPCASSGGPTNLPWITATCRPLASSPGRYQFNFLPTKSVTHTFSMSIDNRPAFNFTVPARAIIPPPYPNAPGTPSFIWGLPSISVSGVNTQYNITITDENRNIRSVAGTNDQPAITINQLTSPVVGGGAPLLVTPSIVRYGGANYTYQYAAGKVGVYTLAVSVYGASISLLANNTRVTTVIPGAMVPRQCLVYGDGLSGGIGGQQATFTILLRDINQNTILAQNLNLSTFVSHTQTR